MSLPQVQIKHVELPSKINVFYRESGPSNALVILLLHGFPSSSHQYRNLIPILASKYHVIAPDLPGFGFSSVPSTLAFEYTFAIFDYGAPTGLGEFWDPIKQFWASDNTPADREKLGAALLSYEATKWQYEEGTREPSSIAPESHTLDYALLQRPGNSDVATGSFPGL
ncbi:Alpha/Beta hydrolase protein [Lipomyces chichibuensis]|uniref:Alpha/Beta hydrolase protein n=1 Tax=Lipomyces chichibuensis TaxID=1546026 RepID=UPI00334385C4